MHFFHFPTRIDTTLRPVSAFASAHRNGSNSHFVINAFCLILARCSLSDRGPDWSVPIFKVFVNGGAPLGVWGMEVPQWGPGAELLVGVWGEAPKRSAIFANMSEI